MLVPDMQHSYKLTTFAAAILAFVLLTVYIHLHKYLCNVVHLHVNLNFVPSEHFHSDNVRIYIMVMLRNTECDVTRASRVVIGI